VFAVTKWLANVELANPFQSRYTERDWGCGQLTLGAKRKENRQINFRVSEDEFQRLEQLATNVGMSVPTFCKKKAQGAKVKSPAIDREGAFEIARELRKIGGNVNQIAKHLNRGHDPLEGQLEVVEKELHALWQRFNSALQK